MSYSQREKPFEKDLPLNLTFNKQPELQASSAFLTNMYVIYDEDSEKQIRLRPFRGKEEFLAFPSGNGSRAAFISGNYVYTVVGNIVYRIDNNFNISQIGQLNTFDSHVRIIANQLEPAPQILFVDGESGYIWDGITFKQITNPAFPANPIDSDYIDGRFIVLDGDTNDWYESGINAGFDWSTLNQAQITTRADKLVAIAILHRRIYLFGKISIENWFDAGKPGFPFARDNNVALDYGCAAVGSVAVGFDRMFFLSRTDEGIGSVMRVTGVNPEPISDQAVVYQLHKLTNPSDAVGYITKTADDHILYVLNFTTDNLTLVWDDYSGRWSIKQTLNGDREQGQTHFFFQGKHLVGGYNNAILYEESEEFLDNAGEEVPFIARFPVIFEEGFRKIRIDKIKFYINQIMGNNLTPDSQMLLFLKISKDGGATFGNQRSVQIRRMGDFGYTSIFRKLGAGSAQVIEIKHVGKTKFSILGAHMWGSILPQ